ncbi:MAG: hypothetical protein ACK4XJ_04665 [Fimbriimonadaceae bacterium]
MRHFSLISDDPFRRSRRSGYGIVGLFVLLGGLYLWIERPWVRGGLGVAGESPVSYNWPIFAISAPPGAIDVKFTPNARDEFMRRLPRRGAPPSPPTSEWSLLFSHANGPEVVWPHLVTAMERAGCQRAAYAETDDGYGTELARVEEFVCERQGVHATLRWWHSSASENGTHGYQVLLGRPPPQH